MEEILRKFKSFEEEKRNLQEQINNVEKIRNELAEKRNSIKSANKYNNDEEVWSEINCLGRQISDLGNQSQWFQNQINFKLITIKQQSYMEIDNLIAEEMRKIRIINEQIEENENYSGDPNSTYENKKSISEIEKSISDFAWIKKMIKYGEIDKILIQTTEQENQTQETIIENATYDVENQEVQPQIEPLKVEEFEPVLEEIKIDELNIDTFEDVDEPRIEDLIIENYNLIRDKVSNETNENTSNTKKIEQLEEEIIKTLQQQINNEKEIITYEENKVEEKHIEDTEPITIQNIDVKVEDGALVYKAQISDGSLITINPVKEKSFIKEKSDRNFWKDIIINYAVSVYKNFYSYTIRKMDPVICDILERFATKYNEEPQNIIYNYVMSYSDEDINQEIMPKIVYNLSYIDEVKINKKDLKVLQRIVKNASKNALIETIGMVSMSEKIKCYIRKILNLNTVKALSEGNKDNL